MGKGASARQERAHRGTRAGGGDTSERSGGTKGRLARLVRSGQPEDAPNRGGGSAGRAAGSGAPQAATAIAGRDLDRLVHERVRLGIVSALAVNESLTFNDLKSVLRTTDGNLSVHARKLEDAGYVTCSKGFDGRVPRSVYRLTAAGRRALQRYLDHMEALIHATREDRR